MYFESFIVKRILPNRLQGKKVSKPILRIAVISISLSIVVNLLTLAIVTGFQNEIREKVIGFSAPLFIQNINNANVYESDPIRISKTVEGNARVLNADCQFDRVAYKPGMLQSAGKNNQPKEVLGLVFKGIDASYHTGFLKKHLVEGKIPAYTQKDPSSDIVISQQIKDQLHLTVNDEVTAFFVRNQPITRKLKVVGIYHTGYEDYDSKMVICDLRLNQNLNDWGLEGQLDLADSLYLGKPILGFTLNGDKKYLYIDWGNGPQQASALVINPDMDSVYHASVLQMGKKGTLEKRGESSLRLHFLRTEPLEESTVSKLALTEDGMHYEYRYPKNSTKMAVYRVDVEPMQGTSSEYISGYEIRVNHWNALEKTKLALKEKVERIPDEHGQLTKVVSIFDLEQDLFNWLSILDLNVIIIITLMLIIGIINMGSAMLVMIILRSNFIGIMKALGASNRSIRRIFLLQAAYLIGKGMFYGNLIGLGLYFLQRTTHLFALNPEVYYLDAIPVELTLVHFLLLNLGTFVICLLALLIPSMVISKMNPIKTIKFD